MNTIKYILIFMAAWLVGNACSTDLLELEPQGQTLEANYYQTEEEAFMALIAVYDVTTWSYPWGMSWYATLNAASDDANAGGENALDRIEYVEADEFRLTPTNPGPLNLWIKYYAGIYRANLIQSIDIDSELVELYKAEAKFLRAFFYFDLVRFFGDVPLITTVLSAEEYQPERAPVEQVYELIIRDLSDCIPLLPEKSELSQVEMSRATKGAARSLLGKVYLFLERWEEAEREFSQVISSDEYGLEENYNDIFTLDHQHGIESIIEFNFTDLRGTSWDGPYSYMEGNIDIQLMGIRDLVMNSGLPEALAPGWGFIKPTEDLVTEFLDYADPVRLESNIIYGDSLIAEGATFNDDFGYEGYFRKKYSAKIEDAPLNQWMYAQDYINLRYADLLLMYAEAAYNNGNQSAALDAINQVRARVDLPALSLSGEAIFEAIVKERRLELALEGLRYWDVLRWGMAEEEFGPLGYNPATNGLWPIPQDEILRTDGSLTQNPGYN